MIETLKNTREFKIVYGNGNSHATSNLVLYWLNNGKEFNKYGFSISTRIGKAVTRNKLKRRLKEIIRHNQDNLKNGYDLIFIARKPVVELNYHRIEKDVTYLFKRAGIWKS